MMDDNLDISELYYDSAISGETYLYCVEKGINTIEELVVSDISDATGQIYVELSTIKGSRQQSRVATTCNDEDNITTLVEQAKSNIDPDSFSQCITLKDVYALAMEITLDVRSHNILKNILANCNDNLESFAEYYLKCSERELMRLRNCGRKTIEIILTKRDYILSNYTILPKDQDDELAERPHYAVIERGETKPLKHQEQLSNELIAILSPIWENKRSLLSTRAKHVLSSCYEGKEWHDVFLKLISPNFSFFKCRNCGKQTAKELCKFIDEMSSVFSGISDDDLKITESYDALKGRDVLKEKEYRNLLNLSDESVRAIIAVEQRLNRFPLFLTIQKFIEELDTRRKKILYGLIDIYNNQELTTRDKLGQELGLSSERLRQLRNKVFSDLKRYIRTIGLRVDVSLYESNSVARYNSEEGTNFQDNLIYLAVSLSNGKWTIIGDTEDVFFNPYGHQINLNIVPAEIAKEYDFKRFLKEFDAIYKSKRTIDTELDFQSFCLKFFKKRVQINSFDDIVHECKKMVFRLYDCTSRGDVIIMGSNTYRGLSEIAEELLREHGQPMSAKELYQAFQDKYPERKCKSETSLISAARLNPNIRPISRTGIYTLSEWDMGESRSGTIREFCEEYLLGTEEKIAMVSALGDYVRQFRPSASDASIQSNLLAESNKKYMIFTRGEQRYIGFSGREYDKSYTPINVGTMQVRPFSVSRRLLEEFIIANNRFPFGYGDDLDDDERRLGRFWHNVQTKVHRQIASPEETEMVQYIEQKYQGLDIPKNEYKWRVAHKSICDLLELGGKDALSESDQRWCYKYIQKLKNQQLEPWQIPLVINLIDLYVKG